MSQRTNEIGTELDVTPTDMRTPHSEARDATEPLGHSKRQSSSSPQAEAAELVAQMGEKELMEAITSTNHWIKIAAAFAIARNPTPDLVYALIQETSRSPDAFTRSRMRAAIAAISCDDCVPALLSRVGTKPDRDIQEAVRTALLRSSSPAVVSALISYAEAADDNDYLWRDVGRILASVRNPDSIPQLLAGLESTNQAVFAGCSLALAGIGEPVGVQALFDQLNDTGEFRNTILIDAIAHARSPAALPILSSVLTNPGAGSNRGARLAALRALGNFSLEQRTPILNQFLLFETDPQLVTEARKLFNN